jgi:type IV pilus assembly protein PilQ
MRPIRKAAVSAAAGIVLFLAFSSPANAGRAPEKKAPRKPVAKAEQARPTDPDSPWQGEPISLDLKDADLKDVLRTFAELTKINIAIDPEVKGSVTVRFNDVPWDQALDVVLRMNGLGYVLEGRILRVGRPEKLIRRD